MNINFKTHFPWNGPDGNPEPTLFATQIKNEVNRDPDTRRGERYRYKLHTIRRINHGKPRFREGMKLTFSTGSRFKPERFGEAVCTGTQHLKMSLQVKDNRMELFVAICHPATIPIYLKPSKFAALAQNDGLSSENFTKWFAQDLIANGPGDYQLVHWTDLRY